jgi:hypothetical protein
VLFLCTLLDHVWPRSRKQESWDRVHFQMSCGVLASHPLWSLKQITHAFLFTLSEDIVLELALSCWWFVWSHSHSNIFVSPGPFLEEGSSLLEVLSMITGKKSLCYKNWAIHDMSI